MNSEHVKLDSDENTTNLDRDAGDGYRSQSKSCCCKWLQPSRKRAASNCTTVSVVVQYLHYYHASSTNSCEGNAHRSLTPGWSMRDYSHWFLVDCEDMRAIRVHCRGCLISPCSAESLAYVLCPVINVNLCSL